MDYRKTAQEIYDHVGKKTSFLQPTVQQDFVWSLQIMTRQTRNTWRISTE